MTRAPETGRDPFEHSDAAFVFGGLEPAERSAFQAHLVGCADCRARVAAARSTLALLGPAAGFATAPDDTPPMPDTLLPGLLRRAVRLRRRRQVWTASVAAVAAACLVTLVVVLWPGGSPARTREQALTSVRPNPVVATARLVAKNWGTEIDVKCRYEEKIRETTGYDLRVIDTDNRAHPAGAWTLTSGQSITFTGGTDVRRERIAKVQITLPDGTPILELKL